MFRPHVVAAILPALLILAAGCGRRPLLSNQTPLQDRADLEKRYDAIQISTPEAEIEAFLGKQGFALAGCSTSPVQRKPESGYGMVAANESSKYWASADGAGAIHVVFGSDGQARLIEWLDITPMGPPSGLKEEP